MSAQFKSRLLNILQREFDAQGLNLPGSCRSQLEQLVGRGISRMRANHVLDSPSHINNAERNLKALIRYFADHAREVGSYPTLSDADFHTALVGCPTFWPYWSS